MKDKQFIYEYNGVNYPVIVTRKRVKNIIYRFKDDTFYISVPWFAFQNDVIKGLDRFAPRLINGSKKRKDNPPIGEDYIYILGERYPLQEQGIISFEDQEISYGNKDELLIKLKKWFLNYVIIRNREFEMAMNLPKYRVKVRDMTSRYGSNSKHTKSITFATLLLHYSKEIIDSVIVHELAHDVVYNHSGKFYNLVYQYCPNYDDCHKKLRKGEFK